MFATHNRTEPVADELAAILDQFDVLEQQMFQLCLQGFAAPQIAKSLGASRWTVRRTLDRIGDLLERRFRETLE